MSYNLNYDELKDVFHKLSKDYKIFAPTRLSSIGTYSDTDIIRYSEVSDPSEIVYDEKSHFSPKEIYFPITQSLFYYFNNELVKPKINNDKYIIIMRPCDINSLKVFDSIYLMNGENSDIYYSELRDKIKIFLLECKTPFDNCFCVTMNTNKTENYEVALSFKKDNIIVNVKDNEFANYFKSYCKSNEELCFCEENSVKVNLPDPEKITKQMYNHEMWTEYNSRCIACGRCNFVCPTCTCFTSQDIKYSNSDNNGERRRVWASCHVDRYSDMAGGHSFRKKNGERMRFKVFHKIYDFKKRFNFHMCTGCGRCDDICPEYISYHNAINKLTKHSEGEA